MRLVLLIAAACGFFCASAAFAQERTLDEIKAEAVKRAENGMYPLIGLDPADVKEAFASIKSSDYDEWAASFRSEEHTSELQSHVNLVCRLLLEKKKKKYKNN